MRMFACERGWVQVQARACVCVHACLYVRVYVVGGSRGRGGGGKVADTRGQLLHWVLNELLPSANTSVHIACIQN